MFAITPSVHYQFSVIFSDWRLQRGHDSYGMLSVCCYTGIKSELLRSLIGCLSCIWTPMLSFNTCKVTRDNVTITLWDLGGQPRFRSFRSMWERYCLGVSAIELATEFHLKRKCRFMGSQMQPEALSNQAFIDQRSLDSLTDREVSRAFKDRKLDSFLICKPHLMSLFSLFLFDLFILSMMIDTFCGSRIRCRYISR